MAALNVSRLSPPRVWVQQMAHPPAHCAGSRRAARIPDTPPTPPHPPSHPGQQPLLSLSSATATGESQLTRVDVSEQPEGLKAGAAAAHPREASPGRE